MSKYILLLIFATILPFNTRAQDACTFDFASVIALLDDNPTLDQVAEARAIIQLQEANCRDYAPDDAGSSRTNPVPFGQRQQVTDDDDYEGSIELIDFLDDAESVVLQVSRSNDPAPTGKKYILVSFHFACERDPDESCEFSRIHFSTVGDKGISYGWDDGRVSGLTDIEEFFGGSEIVAIVGFLVDEDDDNFILFTEYGEPRTFFATE